MAIFERLGDLIRSNINDLIDRAENPEKMVKQIIIDMEEQLRDATAGYATAMGGVNQVRKQMEQAQAQSKEWERKAKMALSAGNEELAKQALVKKSDADNLAATYSTNYETMNTRLMDMKSQIDILKQKLSEARSRQAMLIARSKMADANEAMAKSLGNMDSGSAFAKMDKMEAKIADKEARADAFSEVSGVDTMTETDPFAAMEQDMAVNSDLERLKKEMGLL
ncbi:PspA/IM30 family protein [uncultured Flavonifractor sp.]|uniref:PspA/IM30 family protein n=1 Tax=uncultured Flavonifractor sp. TaxID=1193534 RepID=UPI00260C7EFC|nr:PspA/IM30 family protein [uncultured Flavonifractor sp.]